MIYISHILNSCPNHKLNSEIIKHLWLTFVVDTQPVKIDPKFGNYKHQNLQYASYNYF